MKTVIMAGGKGTRISSYAPNIPKPMITLDDCPILEHEIRCLAEQGFDDIIITVSHMADQIINYFGDGSKFGVNIEYYKEKNPLGNAGALFKIKDKLKEDFLLLNADSVFNINFKRFVNYHQSKGGLITLYTHPNDHPYDSGIIIADNNYSVINWITKEEQKPLWYKNRVNAGLHILNPTVLEQTGIDPEMIGHIVNGKVFKVDLDRQILKPFCNSGKMFCYDSSEYVKDMGTPERFEAVLNDYMNGIVNAKNLNNNQKAVFIDRDGTINKYVGFLNNINQFELLPKVEDAIRLINKKGYLAIVITNQPVIARGETSIDELTEIHNKMETLLGHHGSYLDAIFFCPHHPDKGYEGEIKELKIECECRKPKIGMINQAVNRFNIDLSKSWVIGDSEIDIKCGKNANCKTVLIGNGDYNQDFTVESLYEFADKIIK